MPRFLLTALLLLPSAARSALTRKILQTSSILSMGISIKPTEAFDYTFIFGPAPAVITSIGIVLLRSDIIPRFFGYAAIAVGVLFFIAGLLSIFFPRVSEITTGFEIVQICRGIGVLTLAIFILIFRKGTRRVNDFISAD